MDPRTAAWQKLANPATSPDRLQQIANAYPEFWEVIVAALALLGGLLYWLPIGNKMNGGNSPEAAVRQLANSISSKDGAAVYGVLAPSERDPVDGTGGLGDPLQVPVVPPLFLTLLLGLV